MIKVAALVLVLIAIGVPAKSGHDRFEGVSVVDHSGYQDCIAIENASVRVVLGHHCGGRLLEYSLKGNNVLYLDPKQDGWTYEEGKPVIDPYGGRLDIGPELTIPRHPILWLGPWKAEAIGDRAARMTSAEDPVTGVQLIREFRLDESSTHLRVTQFIKNVSDRTVHWCHWSRTLARGGGICLVPVEKESNLPVKYVMYGPGPVINYRPQDEMIRERDGFIEIIGTPQRPKLAMDSHAGRLAYLTPDGLLFVKHFPTYPDRPYNEVANITLSIYYYQDKFCELEPIGPKETIKPGECISFTEDWWLFEYPYPEGDLDLNEISVLMNSPETAGMDRR